MDLQEVKNRYQYSIIVNYFCSLNKMHFTLKTPAQINIFGWCFHPHLSILALKKKTPISFLEAGDEKTNKRRVHFSPSPRLSLLQIPDFRDKLKLSWKEIHGGFVSHGEMSSKAPQVGVLCCPVIPIGTEDQVVNFWKKKENHIFPHKSRPYMQSPIVIFMQRKAIFKREATLLSNRPCNIKSSILHKPNLFHLLSLN